MSGVNKAKSRTIKVFLVDDHEVVRLANGQAIVDAAMAGAAGFVQTQISGNDLVNSIRRSRRA